MKQRILDMKRFIVALMIVTGSLLATGCASNLSGESFSRGEARAVQQVKFGVVEHVRLVAIEGTKTPIGAGAGAIVGGILGSSIGGGRGSTIASVLGAVGGGVLGSKAEEALTKTQGVEITVRLDSGRVIAVVQQASPDESFAVGDRVRVLTLGNRTRISRATS